MFDGPYYHMLTSMRTGGERCYYCGHTIKDRDRGRWVNSEYQGTVTDVVDCDKCGGSFKVTFKVSNVEGEKPPSNDCLPYISLPYNIQKLFQDIVIDNGGAGRDYVAVPMFEHVPGLTPEIAGTYESEGGTKWLAVAQHPVRLPDGGVYYVLFDKAPKPVVMHPPTKTAKSRKKD